MQGLPVNALYQTVYQTALPDTCSTGQFDIRTPDFEGILLWNLRPGGDEVVPVHR